MNDGEGISYRGIAIGSKRGHGKFLFFGAVNKGNSLAGLALFVVGFLGGFTTFSSFSMETMLLFAGTDIFYALSNIAANMGAGLFAVWLGMCLARGV